MRAAWCGALFIGAVFTIAGCRGGSSSIPSAPISNGAAAQPASAASRRRHERARSSIVLPTIVAPKPLPTPSRPGHAILLLVGHAVGLGVVRQDHIRSNRCFGSRVPTATAVAGGGRSCTIQAKVQSGTCKLELATYGAKASFGRLAFVPKTRVEVLPGVLNYVKPLKWFGVATGVKITSSRTKLTQFKPAQMLLTVTGVDGSGARIPEADLDRQREVVAFGP